MPYVVGNEIEAHCTACGHDRAHTVMEVWEGLVRLVRCNECREVHPYQRPHGPPRPARSAEPRERKRRAKRHEPSGPAAWEELMASAGASAARAYAPSETFALGDVVTHGAFGLGVVTQVHSDRKVDVVFREGTKRLVHDRR